MSKRIYFLIQDENDYIRFINLADHEIGERFVGHDDFIVASSGIQSQFPLDYELFKSRFSDQPCIIKASYKNRYLYEFEVYFSPDHNTSQLIKEFIGVNDEAFFMDDLVNVTAFRVFKTNSNVNDYLLTSLNKNVIDFIKYKHRYYEDNLAKLKQLIIILVAKMGPEFSTGYYKLTMEYLPMLVQLASVNMSHFASEREIKLAELALNYCKNLLYPAIKAQKAVNKPIIKGIIDRHKLDVIFDIEVPIVEDQVKFKNDVIDNMFNINEEVSISENISTSETHLNDRFSTLDLSMHSESDISSYTSWSGY